MRKRLTDSAIAKLEDMIAAGNGETSSVFGVCDMSKSVVRRWKLVDRLPVATDDEPTIMIPERLEKLLFPKRRKIVLGGRGSAKTRTIISILTERSKAQRERIVCLREIMKSISESSYRELMDEIDRKGHADYFSTTENKIRVPSTGSSISFEGLLRNVTKIKGYAGATIAWVEEGENVSRSSWEVLTPTIREAGSEIWVSFNPAEETDPTWADLVAPYWDKAVDGIYEDEHTLIIECNHTHNPWLTEELILERDMMASRDHDRYMWIWEGKFRRNSDVKVLNGKWIVESFEPSKDWDGPYFGADFGFAADPSTLVKCWIHDHKLYVEHEAYEKGVELDDMPDFYARVPGSKEHKIYADSARPETISHIKRRGYNIVAVDKWPGSVEDGITFLRSFEKIVIHTRCRNTMQEANLYQYKTDRLTGDILPDVVDDNNHCVDALRYAVGKLIKKKGKSYYDY
ncbi:XtmB Phage terminase large subunit [uncultured Caudovirales phage]|uniref:XtmB Phage terminase large subunit n=1 Tax=uncultured Caudovirales phage TaxID=2100421 RepID=A0A6J7WAE2_9CAUD|nr:XtmB Phage terminase large subunit [uncultured Caudovirales phage]